VQAINQDTGEETVGAYSGAANLSFNPATGGLSLISNVGVAIPNGNYVIPVPKGNYNVRVEAVDGTPVSAGQVNFTTLVGTSFRQHDFIEEFWNNNNEGAVEREPGDGKRCTSITAR
jgi:hypothetical protein